MATKEATFWIPMIRATATALAATAANPELGPVEICRLVPKTAYRIAPAAAAYKPFCSGIPAIPGYPRFFGTIRAATATPAMRSPFSQRRWSLFVPLGPRALTADHRWGSTLPRIIAGWRGPSRYRRGALRS